MSAQPEFELDRAGVAEILKSASMGAAVRAAADAVAAQLPGAYVDYYVTDRQAASVSIGTSTGGEAKTGTLAAAASRAGLEYRGSA